VPERDRLDAAVHDRRAVERVEALETRAGVVEAVRVVPVDEALARQFDLVRGVVRVEPGRRAVAQADLQQRGGYEQRQHHAGGGDD
jgi:hypothetical protein